MTGYSLEWMEDGTFVEVLYTALVFFLGSDVVVRYRDQLNRAAYSEFTVVHFFCSSIVDQRKAVKFVKELAQPAFITSELRFVLILLSNCKDVYQELQ